MKRKPWSQVHRVTPPGRRSLRLTLQTSWSFGERHRRHRGLPSGIRGYLPPPLPSPPLPSPPLPRSPTDRTRRKYGVPIQKDDEFLLTCEFLCSLLTPAVLTGFFFFLFFLQLFLTSPSDKSLVFFPLLRAIVALSTDRHSLCANSED